MAASTLPLLAPPDARQLHLQLQLIRRSLRQQLRLTLRLQLHLPLHLQVLLPQKSRCAHHPPASLTWTAAGFRHIFALLLQLPLCRCHQHHQRRCSHRCCQRHQPSRSSTTAAVQSTDRLAS